MIQIKENVLQADMKSGLNSTDKILNFSTFNVLKQYFLALGTVPLSYSLSLVWNLIMYIERLLKQSYFDSFD